ncbi:MAG: hypothetical protein O2954_09085 [bacterium]|nr:hypothetical protein [bacterium]
MRHLILTFLLTFLLAISTATHAADLPPIRHNLSLHPKQTTLPNPLLQDNASTHETSRSSKAAFFMSLVVPGLGQLYTGSPNLAAVFIGVEAFTWINWARWRSKGNDLKADFRVFADQNWNETRYLEWQAYNRSHGSPYNETETLPCKHDGPNCEKVDTQQYYEMIGKYDQFVFGWSDVTADFDVTLTDASKLTTLSNLREDYENQRNDSNKNLKRASVVIGFAVINRVISAIHASTHARSLDQDQTPRRFWVHLSPIDAEGRTAPSFAINTRF